MAHQHHIANFTPASTLPKGTPTDMYADGMKNLRGLARKGKLSKFHWPSLAGWSHPQEGEAVDNRGDESDSD